jgi:hypothetical protein
VKVITPGWIVADPSGAHATALPALDNITTASTQSPAATLSAKFI